MSVDRKARIANGFLVLASSLLALTVDLRFGWLAVFMGISLIFSGATDFCGFAVIFRKLGL
ncbi:MAG: YgaP-like transmembrane domain [Rubripirellula sp.]